MAYERTARVTFFFVEPQTGRRHVPVTEQRTTIAFAHAMQWLRTKATPKPRRISVLDNLNTHKIASLYEAFEPAEARRIARKRWRYCTVQARESVAYGRERVECPAAPMPRPSYLDAATLGRAIVAWEQQRNTEQGLLIGAFCLRCAQETQRLSGNRAWQNTRLIRELAHIL